MQCPLRFCQKYSYTKEWVLLIIILLLIGSIWLFKLNQPWFYGINNMYPVLPTIVWQTLNYIAYSKFAILPIILVILTWLFHRSKLANVVLVIVIFYVSFYILKVLVGEPRPYVILQMNSFYWLNQFEDSAKNAYKSFPSGHTGNMAIFVFSLIELFFSKSWIAKILLFTLLILTGLARICTGWHWPIDIIASGLIAYILVRICLSINFSKFKNSI